MPAPVEIGHNGKFRVTHSSFNCRMLHDPTQGGPVFPPDFPAAFPHQRDYRDDICFPPHEQLPQAPATISTTVEGQGIQPKKQVNSLREQHEEVLLTKKWLLGQRNTEVWKGTCQSLIIHVHMVKAMICEAFRFGVEQRKLKMGLFLRHKEAVAIQREEDRDCARLLTAMKAVFKTSHRKGEDGYAKVLDQISHQKLYM